MKPRSSEQSPHRILLVDDDTLILATLSQLLKKHGYSISTASSGDDALALIRQEHFDLIVTDYMMDAVDGLTVIQRVKELSPDSMVVLLTGFGDIESAVSALRLDADDYLTKPIKAEKFLRRLHNCLEKLELRRRVHRSEAELQIRNKAIEQLDQGIIMIDTEQEKSAIVYANTGFEGLTGYASQDVVGKNIEILYGPDTDLDAMDRLQIAISNETRYSGEVIHYRSDGSPFWNSVTAAPVHDAAGKVICFILTFFDISRHKQLEASLRESEARFRQLTENIDDIFILTQPYMRDILYVSPSFESIWGQSCDDMYADPDSRFTYILADDRLKVMRLWSQPIEQKYELKYRILPPGQDILWIRERGFPIRDSKGRVRRIAVIMSDISSEKRLREESEIRLQQVIQADRLAALGEVVAGVAHEINNPNSFITYNIPMLEETWQIFEPILSEYASAHPDWRHEHMTFPELMTDMNDIIQAIRTGSARINRVVTNLKDFARLDESTHTHSVNVNVVIDKTMTIVGAQLRKSSRAIHVDLSQAVPEIQGHGQKLEQVFANLLVNAAHAVSHRDDGKICISTRHIERLNAIVVEIEDNGSGMSRDVVDHIFEPFFTTRRTEGGTGLGLSVSYGLIKEHRGILGVLSRPGIGSRFSVYLPLSQTESVALNPTILCVDDDISVLKLLKSMLVKVEDQFVETAVQSEGILDYLDAHPEVDIVFSDIIMSGLNGWDLLQKIKSRYPLIAVVLYSGNPAALENEDRTFLPDFTLKKPFDRTKLIQVIHSIGRQRL